MLKTREYQSLIARTANTITELHENVHIFSDIVRNMGQNGQSKEEKAPWYSKISKAKKEIAVLSEIQCGLKDDLRNRVNLFRLERA